LLAAGAGIATASAVGLTGCGKKAPEPTPEAPTGINWRLVTSWPRGLKGPANAARMFAQRVTRLSGGRLTVKVYPAGSLVSAFEVLDAVSDGRAEAGHSAAHFWSGRSPAAPFFATVPFGLTAQEMSGWLYRGGGMQLWRELYQGFGVVPFACGNLGVQMAGWFKREIRSLRDIKGLKMRLPGLGGDVWRRIGGVPVEVRGEELRAAFADGRIDAAEWMSPYNDIDTDLREAARYCYFPGWQEPGCTLELIINQRALAELPEDLRMIVEVTAQSVNEAIVALYSARNPVALDALANREQTEFRQLPADVLGALKEASAQVLVDLAASDEFTRRVYTSWLAYREQSRQWLRLSEWAFLEARN
jgi:TRAP-type mannitol/chloroaromatic compound transport system substrate-binding protein